MSRQSCYPLNTVPQNFSPNNTGFPATNSHHPCNHLTTLPAPERNMKGTLIKYNSEVVPLSDDGITDVDSYRDCLRTLHSQAVVEATRKLSCRKYDRHMYGCPENFRESLTMPTATFPEIFNGLLFRLSL